MFGCYHDTVDITLVEDLDALLHFHSVLDVAHEHDFVALPADPIEELIPTLRGEHEAGERTLLYLARCEGTPVAAMKLTLYLLDNLTAANLDLAVHPQHRRLGHGGATLAFGIAEAQRRGRSRIFLEVPSAPDGSEGPAASLMRRVGARPVLEDLRRLLDLRVHRAEPTPVPDGYQVVQWVDHAPEELVDGAAYLMSRMTIDAPMGEMDYEREKWDATRYRDKEAAAIARRRMRIATAVIHNDSGAVAGITDIGINRDRSAVAYQWDTIVDPDHRGHGLGMVLKTWNHRLLQEQVPDVAFVNTWNAASNTYMIAVNDALGFAPVERWTEYQLDLAT